MELSDPNLPYLIFCDEKRRFLSEEFGMLIMYTFTLIVAGLLTVTVLSPVFGKVIHRSKCLRIAGGYAMAYFGVERVACCHDVKTWS